MFSYSLFVDSLIKAMGHKYVRRVPKGVTKTGATKYMYFYAGKEGHGKGIAHEEELVTGASFAMGQGDQRHHAHITKVEGDKLTVKYDDGAKKGTEETMTKKQFQRMIQKEHGAGSTQAKPKTTKKPTAQATASSMKQEQPSTKPTPSEQTQTTTQSKQEQVPPEFLTIFKKTLNQKKQLNSIDALVAFVKQADLIAKREYQTGLSASHVVDAMETSTFRKILDPRIPIYIYSQTNPDPFYGHSKEIGSTAVRDTLKAYLRKRETRDQIIKQVMEGVINGVPNDDIVNSVNQNIQKELDKIVNTLKDSEKKNV